MFPETYCFLLTFFIKKLAKFYIYSLPENDELEKTDYFSVLRSVNGGAPDCRQDIYIAAL